MYVKRDFCWYEVLQPEDARHRRDVLARGSSTTRSTSSSSRPTRSTAGQTCAGPPIAIRDHIREAAGLPVTVGIARTRTLAKLITDTAKPFGAVAVLDRDHERELLAKLPVTEITGIAGRRAARLAPTASAPASTWPTPTAGWSAAADQDRLRAVAGAQRHAGHPHPARAARRTRCSARGGSLMGNVDRPDHAVGLARPPPRAADRGAAVPRRPDRRARRSQVAWKDGDSTGGVVPAADAPPTGSTTCSTPPGWPCGGPTSRRRRPPTCTSSPPSCGAAKGFQLSLFDVPDPKRDAVAAAKAAVNERFGRFKVRSGDDAVPAGGVPDPANDFDICDVRGKVCF